MSSKKENPKEDKVVTEEGSNGTQEAALKPQLQIAGNMEAFNVKLFGGYDSDSKCFIIKQLNAGEKDISYTLSKFMDDLNDLLKELANTEIAKDSLPPQLQTVMDGTAVYVNEVYLKVAGSDNGGKAQSEYAIWVGLDGSAIQLPVKINELYLKVWKTNNPQVIKTLQIITLEELMALSAGEKEEQKQIAAGDNGTDDANNDPESKTDQAEKK